MNVSGALAVVSGASSGIGAATAKLLAREGARVVLLARDPTRLDQVVAQIRSQQGEAERYVVDLADAAQIALMARTIQADVGTPDILVNNAGAGRWLSLLETSAEQAAQMMAVPYLAAFNLTRDFLPAMLKRGTGHIVNVTSVAARLAWPGAVAYATARSAMAGFNTALRADLYGSSIGVTLAMFGTVETPYWEHNPGSRERLPKQARAQRALTPEEAAAAIVQGIEHNRRLVLKPTIFRLLFLLNQLFPAQTEAMMCRRD